MTEQLILNLIFLLAFLCINILGIIKLSKPTEISKKKKSKKVSIKPKKVTSAKNSKSSVMNASVDYQKIKTAEIELPVIAEDVLVYEGGELGAAYPNTTRLYYSKEAISDPEFLETVKRSAFQIGTHEKNTEEFNRLVDGWPTDVWWDDTEKRVMAKGVLHGMENVDYAKENLNKPGFGTSAFISFLKLEKSSGIAPNGKPYDAIVRKAVNNHIAILPNIRDPKNTIVAMNNKVIVAFNAVEEKEEIKSEVKNPSEWVEDDSLWKKAEEQAEKEKYPKDDYAIVTAIYKKMGGKIKGENSMAMNEEEFKSMYNKVRNEEAAEKEKAEKLKNEIKNEIAEETKSKETEPIKEKNAKNEEETEKEKKEEETENAEDKEEAEAANAKPSDEMLKDFSSHLGIVFHKTPSLKALGKIVGLEAKNTAELITALNAKRKEFTSGKTEPSEAKNSNDQKSSLDELMKRV